MIHSKKPEDFNVSIISVDGLSFERYLEAIEYMDKAFKNYDAYSQKKSLELAMKKLKWVKLSF